MIRGSSILRQTAALRQLRTGAARRAIVLAIGTGSMKPVSEFAYCPPARAPLPIFGVYRKSAHVPRVSSSGNFQSLNEPAPSPPLKLSGLAVTENHYLVAGTIEPAGLLIFDLYSGGEPRQILWPNAVDFEPFDMAARPGGGVWILDRRHKSYWALDRNFNVIGGDAGTLSPEKTDDFQPVDGSSLRQTAARSFPASFSLLQSPVVAIDPIAIEALPDETVLILDYDPTKNFSRIYRYRYATRLPDEISTEAILEKIEKSDKADFKLIGYDIAFVPEHTERELKVPDSLYVVGADGNQTYPFTVCLRDRTDRVTAADLNTSRCVCLAAKHSSRQTAARITILRKTGFPSCNNGARVMWQKRR